ncbi:hypothetical protein Cgig2_026176 [Carnegiea gigantea]|uniref:F-box protein n=1 Tax=Carnegiea gigantea TaxID=171969 RepID=A0A9Q1K564_9CARY|nr:hypothetical protein Cgig2_026176 [Carnegiea gigantea]
MRKQKFLCSSRHLIFPFSAQTDTRDTAPSSSEVPSTFQVRKQKVVRLDQQPFFIKPHLHRSLDYYNDTTKTVLAFMNDTGVYLIDDLTYPGPQPTRLNWLQPYDLDHTSMRLTQIPHCMPPSDYEAGFGHDMENDDYKGSSTVHVSPRSSITHSTVDIWIMKEYGLQGSWHKLASVDHSLHHLRSIWPAFITYSEEGASFYFRMTAVLLISSGMIQKRKHTQDLEQFGSDFVVCAESIVSITSSSKEE